MEDELTANKLNKDLQLGAAYNTTEGNKMDAFSSGSAVILLSGEKTHFGTIIKANSGVFRCFGYSPEDLVGKPISVLMPNGIWENHSKLMIKFGNTGEPRSKNFLLKSFGLNKKGFIFPIQIEKRQICTLQHGIIFLGTVKQDLSQMENDYILTDYNGIIKGISAGVSAYFHLPSSLNKSNGGFYLQYITPDLPPDLPYFEGLIKMTFEIPKGLEKGIDQSILEKMEEQRSNWINSNLIDNRYGQKNTKKQKNYKGISEKDKEVVKLKCEISKHVKTKFNDQELIQLMLFRLPKLSRTVRRSKKQLTKPKIICDDGSSSAGVSTSRSPKKVHLSSRVVPQHHKQRLSILSARNSGDLFVCHLKNQLQAKHDGSTETLPIEEGINSYFSGGDSAHEKGEDAKKSNESHENVLSVNPSQLIRNKKITKSIGSVSSVSGTENPIAKIISEIKSQDYEKFNPSSIIRLKWMSRIFILLLIIFITVVMALTIIFDLGMHLYSETLVNNSRRYISISSIARISRQLLLLQKGSYTKTTALINDNIRISNYDYRQILYQLMKLSGQDINTKLLQISSYREYLINALEFRLTSLVKYQSLITQSAIHFDAKK